MPKAKRYHVLVRTHMLERYEVIADSETKAKDADYVMQHGKDLYDSEVDDVDILAVYRAEPRAAKLTSKLKMQYDLRESTPFNRLKASAKDVISKWEAGDLAGAVRNLQAVIEELESKGVERYRV